MTGLEFKEFPKIGRYSREVVVSEKIDGTNSSIYITEAGDFLTGSRTRWIQPVNDNQGFSKWAHDHKEELMKLGPGHHFGEWWGSKIQRGYGLKNGLRMWSLFNTTRWCVHDAEPQPIPTLDPRVTRMQERLPDLPGLGLVPILWRGLFDQLCLYEIMQDLWKWGSRAMPGYMEPEGVVVYHTANGAMFKKTFDKDSAGKTHGA